MKHLNRLLLFAGLLCSPLIALCDDILDGSGEDVPIDGGLSVLLIAGTAYGAKKVVQTAKKRKSELEDKGKE